MPTLYAFRHPRDTNMDSFICDFCFLKASHINTGLKMSTQLANEYDYTQFIYLSLTK